MTLPRTTNFPTHPRFLERFRQMHAIRQAGGMTRFHMEPGIPQQTTAAHSWGVAMLAWKFWPEDTVLLVAALAHDVGELGCGDVPGPAKWEHPELAAITNRIEAEVRADLGLNLPLTYAQQERLKFCDRLELAWYCAELALTGSRYAVAIFNKLTASMDKANPHITPEANDMLWSLCAMMEDLHDGK